MKKKSLLVGAVMVMSAMMLNACGGPSKEDYKADVKTLSEFTEDFSSLDFSADDMSDYEEAAGKMEMKTEEGKVLKKDMEKLGDYLGDMKDMMEDLENFDEEEAEKLEENVDELQKKTEDHVKDFKDAAKDAGLKDEDLEKLDI